MSSFYESNHSQPSAIKPEVILSLLPHAAAVGNLGPAQNAPMHPGQVECFTNDEQFSVAPKSDAYS